VKQALVYGLFVLTSLLSRNAFSADSNCLDSAKTNKELDDCAVTFVRAEQDKVDVTFAGLKKRYQGDDEMQHLIDIANKQWLGYTNTQCLLEGAIAQGVPRKLDQHLPEVNRVFLKCVFRTAREMGNALSK
jgi:hypothetical protein